MFSARGDLLECKELEISVSNDPVDICWVRSYMVLIRGSSSSFCNKTLSTSAACVQDFWVHVVTPMSKWLVKSPPSSHSRRGVLAVIETNIDNSKINLVGEQNVAETAEAIAQALSRRRNRIVTTNAGGIIAPRQVCRW